ncbi:F-box/WD repeat-containing protein 4 [Aricia agestis]|uniref:F-box/WD repeat-containing protein 4 n=1 Tax=Aricia agestis TaxID=91739 RepID=UPI001C202154|nr:F-box/WD repeat-containing protein 4 [Aricia agestis]
MTNLNLVLLPLDVLATIFAYLEISDLRNVMLTCKSLKEIIVNETRIWRPRIHNKLIIQFYSDNNTFNLYNRCRISHNWRNGIFKNKVIIQHNTNYMPWMKFHESKALFLSVGANLQCYSIDRKGLHRNNLLWTLPVPTVKRDDIRTNDISRFVYKGRLLACGNRDGSVAVFDMEDYTKKPTLLGHIENCHQSGQVEVSAVETINSNIVTVSDNSPCIMFWQRQTDNINNPYCKTSISLSGVIGCRCLAASKCETQLAVGLNGNSKPLLLDVTTNKILISPSESMNSKQVVRDIRWRDDNTFVYVTHSSALGMIDTRVGHTVYEAMDPFQSSLYCVRTDSDNAVVVGCAEYSRCVLYDVRQTYRHVQIYFTQKKMSPVYSMDFDTSKLIAAADRGVAVLNFNVSSATTAPKDYSHAFQ